MGAACCIAAKSKLASDEPTVVASRVNIHCSPSWNIRWDNRGRVTGEETAVRWFADMSSRDSQLENISETAVRTISEEGSPDNFQPPAWNRSPIPGAISVRDFRSPNSDASISRSMSMEGKDTIDYPAATDRSLMIPSLSSLSTSPLSTGGHLFHPSLTPARIIRRRTPRNQLYMQVLDDRMPSFKSPATYEDKIPPMHPGWANESARQSLGGSSDSWSIPEYMTSTQRERWSFDSDTLGFNNRDTITRASSHPSPSQSFCLKSCVLCSKLLSDKSSFGSQKLIPTNELAVVAVLVCGHSYHAECLERMSLGASKFDPACPVCTFGEQQTMKLSDKAIKAEMESRFKNSKRLRSRVIDSGFQTSFVGVGGKDLKIDSSPNTRVSFLRRHFSLGSSSKGKKSLSESQSSKKKTLYWTKSSK